MGYVTQINNIIKHTKFSSLLHSYQWDTNDEVQHLQCKIKMQRPVCHQHDWLWKVLASLFISHYIASVSNGDQ